MNIDTSHSVVGFGARHLMISKVQGRFTDFSGSVTIAEDPLLQSTVEANVDLVTTGDDQRDAHLKTADFSDIENHPHMTFTSTSLKADDEDYVMTGDLTVSSDRHGRLRAGVRRRREGPVGRYPRRLRRLHEISRKDWEMTWNWLALETGVVLVGDKVKIKLDELVKA